LSKPSVSHAIPCVGVIIRKELAVRILNSHERGGNVRGETRMNAPFVDDQVAQVCFQFPISSWLVLAPKQSYNP